MNRLNAKRRVQVVVAPVEGNSIRATCRMTGVAKGTVLKLLGDLGAACAEYEDRTLRNLPCQRIRCDETWSFCYAKARNVAEAKRGEPGVGDRDAGYAAAFMDDLAGRLANRVQLTTDGHKVYLNTVAGAFAWDVDYAMLVELYGAAPEAEVRYSPVQCIGTRVEAIMGTRTPSTSARHSRSGRTSLCGCRCADSPA